MDENNDNKRPTKEEIRAAIAEVMASRPPRKKYMPITEEQIAENRRHEKKMKRNKILASTADVAMMAMAQGSALGEIVCAYKPVEDSLQEQDDEAPKEQAPTVIMDDVHVVQGSDPNKDKKNK